MLARYAVANKLVSEPAFAWWVLCTLKKREAVLKFVKSRALIKKKEKFGLEVPGLGPNAVKCALKHWGVAMEKEVKTVLPALRILKPGEAVPPGYM